MNELIFPTTQFEAKKKNILYSPDMNKNAVFPTRLRTLRKQKGVTQVYVEKSIGLPSSTLTLYETGQSIPDAKTVYELAHLYGVSTDFLLGNSDSPSLSNEIDIFYEIMLVIKNLSPDKKQIVEKLLVSPKLNDFLDTLIDSRLNTFLDVLTNL